MRIQVTVRDGGLAVAHGRGLERNTKMIEVKRLDDQEVIDYFDLKRDSLLQALEQGHCDHPCNNEECWDGVRCKDYCDVWNFCPKGLLERGGK